MPTSTVSVCARPSQACLPSPLHPLSLPAPAAAAVAVRARPFLKWAGGKRQLLSQILARFPDDFGRYWEPFVGGGAVFFGLAPRQTVLSDINAELINAYVCLRDNVEGVIARLRHYLPTRENYYRARSQCVGNVRGVAAAARTIFLNRTSYNGLYRVNRRGEFNVPFGRHNNPTVCDEPNLLAVSEALQGVELRAASVFDLEQAIKPGHLVYLDPPYDRLPKRSSFVSYTSSGFGRDDQVRLAEMFRRLAGRGVHAVLSNAATEAVRDLYEGFRIDQVTARRSINSHGARRGPVAEVVVSTTS